MHDADADLRGERPECRWIERSHLRWPQRPPMARWWRRFCTLLEGSQTAQSCGVGVDCGWMSKEHDGRGSAIPEHGAGLQEHPMHGERVGVGTAKPPDLGRDGVCAKDDLGNATECAERAGEKTGQIETRDVLYGGSAAGDELAFRRDVSNL